MNMKVPFCHTVAIVGLFVLLMGRVQAFSDYDRRNHIKCHPIQEALCADFGYNLTSMPNIVGHETQKDASNRIREFLPLIESKCSEDLRFFLCSLFFPMCTPQVDVAIPACRPMCEDVRARCEPFMLTFAFEWSDSIDCSLLPEQSEKRRLCMQPPYYDHNREAKEKDELPVKVPPYQLPDSQPEFQDSLDGYPMNPELEYKIISPDLSIESGPPQNPLYPHSDNEYPVTNDDVPSYKDDADGDETWMKNNDAYSEDHSLSESTDEENSFDYESNSNIPSMPQDDPVEAIPAYSLCSNPLKFFFLERSGECVPRCEQGTDVIFSASDKWLAHILLSVCAALCFLSTAVTVGTFVADSKRFRYPERPVIFLSLCYNVYSVGYLLRTISGVNHPLSCLTDESLKAEHLVKGGFESTSCSASFFILYYFGMSASAWWVVLNLTWFLSAGFKWGHEAIEGFGVYFHLVAWGLPAVQTIAALTLGKIDGDELTGVCYVGNLDPESLMYFVIIPLTFYLLTGTVALVFGLTYLFKIRRVIKHQNGKEAANLEKLMIKIGIFSILYTVPATCVVAVYFYQYQNYSLWISKASHVPCVQMNADKTNYYYRDATDNQDEYWPDGGRGYSQSWTNHHNPSGYHYRAEDTNAQRVARSLNNKASFTSPSNSIYDASEKRPDELGLNCGLKTSIPSIPIFFIKVVMSLIAGIMSGIWVWSAKTIQSWRIFCYSCRWKKVSTEEVQDDQDGNIYPRADAGNCLLVGASTTSRIIRTYEEDICFSGKPQCYHQSLERRKYPDDFYCFNTLNLPVAPEAKKFLQSGSYNRGCSQAGSSCCRLSGSRDVEGASGDERACRPHFARECHVASCHSKRTAWPGLSSDYTDRRGNPIQCRHSNPSSQTHLAKYATRCSRDDESSLFFPQVDNSTHRFQEAAEVRTSVSGFTLYHPITNNYLVTSNCGDESFEPLTFVRSS